MEPTQVKYFFSPLAASMPYSQTVLLSYNSDFLEVFFFFFFFLVLSFLAFSAAASRSFFSSSSCFFN